MSTKKSICTSPFQLVYGIDAIFPSSLGILVMKYIEQENSELNPKQRRINRHIELHQIRENLCDKAQTYQDRRSGIKMGCQV